MRGFLLLALLTAATPAAAQTGPRTPANRPASAAQQGGIEQAVRQLDRDLWDAFRRNDTVLFARVATDDYAETDPLGRIVTKAQAMAGAKNFKIESLDTDDVTVRVYTDAAVATGRATVKGQVKTPAGAMQDISGRYRYTAVYVKQQGQWRFAALQVTPIAQPPAQ